MLKHLLRGSGSGAVGDPWVATIGGSNEDKCHSVAVAPDGSVYFCGQTFSAGAGSVDFLLVKFSSSGIVQWQKTFGGSGADFGNYVAIAPDGSVYAYGYTTSAGAGNYDFLIAKFSSSGTVQWQKTLGDSDGENGFSVAVAPDGSVYACGKTNSVNTLNTDLFLVKFSSSGTVQWQKRFGGGNGDYGYSVAVASDGSVYVSGYTYVNGNKNDLLLVKFSSSGTVQWQKTLGGSNDEIGTSVAVAPDGSVYVCGYTRSAGAGNTDLLLAKFSSSGTVQWQKTLGGSGYEEGWSVAVAPDGSVYVCGHTSSAGSGSYDLLLAKFSSSGTVQWQKTLGGSNVEITPGVAVAPDGSVYVCGQTNSAGAGNYDFLLAKITDSIVEKNTVTFGSFIFQDASLTVNNISFTSTSPGFSVSNAGLTVTTPSLTVGTPSLDITLYPYTE